MAVCFVEGADEDAAGWCEVRDRVSSGEHHQGKGWGRRAFFLASSLTWDQANKELRVRSCSSGQEDLYFYMIK